MYVHFSFVDKNPCDLYCKKGSVVYPKGKVEDGTRCRLDPKNKDVCIKGKCRVSKVLVSFSSTTVARSYPMCWNGKG